MRFAPTTNARLRLIQFSSDSLKDEELPDFLADDEYASDLIAKNRPPKGDKRLLTHAPAIDKTRGT